MFKRLIKSNFLCFVRSKENVFWLLLFPIILSILFNLALKDILNDEGFEDINIAVVKDENYKKAQIMVKAIENVSEDKNGNKNDNTLFHTEYVSKEEADKLLNEEDITGYIWFDDEGTSNFVIKKNGIYQTITKKFLDMVEQKIEVANQIITTEQSINSDEQSQIINDTLSDSREYIKPVTSSHNSPNTVVIFFYTILGMTCLYCASIGCDLITNIQSNQSPVAKRNCVAPISKMKIFLAGFITISVISTAIVLAVLAFIAIILKIDFGDRYSLIILTCIVGANTGIALGCLLGAISRKDSRFKSGIIIVFAMTCSYMAGMMNPDVKYQIKKNAYLLDRLNPVNLITESYYKLYYYTKLDKYIENIGILLAMIIICMGVTVFILKRQESNKKAERISL